MYRWDWDWGIDAGMNQSLLWGFGSAVRSWHDELAFFTELNDNT